MATIVQLHWTDPRTPELRQQLTARPSECSSCIALLTPTACQAVHRQGDKQKGKPVDENGGRVIILSTSFHRWLIHWSHTHARTPTPTHRRGAVHVEPALIWLGSCLLLSCLVVYEFCSAVYSPTPASPLSAPTSHNTAFHLSLQICKFRAIIFGKVPNLRL